MGETSFFLFEVCELWYEQDPVANSTITDDTTTTTIPAFEPRSLAGKANASTTELKGKPVEDLYRVSPCWLENQ